MILNYVSKALLDNDIDKVNENIENVVKEKIVKEASGISVSDTVAEMYGLSDTEKDVDSALQKATSIVPEYTVIADISNTIEFDKSAVVSVDLSEPTINFDEIIVKFKGHNSTETDYRQLWIAFESSCSNYVIAYCSGKNNSVAYSKCCDSIIKRVFDDYAYCDSINSNSSYQYRGYSSYFEKFFNDSGKLYLKYGYSDAYKGYVDKMKVIGVKYHEK